MKNLLASNNLTLITACLLPVLGVGCSSTFPVASKLNVNYPAAQKLNLPVELLLTDELQEYTWTAETGAQFTINPGDALCANSEIVARQVFNTVSAVRGSPALSQPAGTYRLTPRVVSVGRAIHGMSAWADAEMEFNLEWTLTDPQGNVVWIRTVKGTGIEKMGSAFSFKAQTQKQVQLALEDAFSKSHRELSTASEIKALAR